MGTRNNKPIEAETDNAGNNNGNSSTSSTGNSGRGTGRGTRGKTSEPTQKSVGLPNVESKPKPIAVTVPGVEQETTTKPTPARGRPAGSKTTRKKPTPKKESTIDASQVSLFLQTMTAVVATRPNMSAFILTKDEADQLAIPLSNIVGKNESIASVAGDYADHITLVIAAITIFIPKFLLFKAQQEMNKPTQLPREEVPRNESTSSTSIATATKQPTNSAGLQNDSHAFNGSINSLISPIA